MSQCYKIMFKSTRLIAILILFLAGATVIAQEYWQSTEGPYGGLIECVVYNSNNEAFAFTHWGGLFYSGDNGDSWVKRGDRLATKVVIDTNDVIITNSLYSADINRSTDGGQTWTTYTKVIDSKRIYALAVNSANLLFAGTDTSGMFRSEDGGATWNQINTNLPYKEINTISTYGARVYIGTKGGKVYRSDNNGDTWIPANTGISETDVYSILHVSSGVLLAGTFSKIYRSDDNGSIWTQVISGLSWVKNIIKTAGNILYASTCNGIYRSDDNGLNWSPMNNGLGNTYVQSLAVSSADVLLAGTYYGFDNGIYRSIDYGVNWTPVNYRLRGVRIWKMAAAPNGIIYAGTYDSGMFRSIDEGYTWESINNGLREHADSQSQNLRALTVSPQGIVYIGTYGAGVFRSEDNGLSWARVITGLTSNWIAGLSCGQTPGLIYAGTFSEGIYKSTNFGDSWTITGTEIEGLSVYDLMVGMNENTVFAGTDTGLWRSTNAGGSWQKVGSGNITSAYIYDVASNSKGDIFIGSSNFGLLRSRDGGTSWDNPKSNTIALAVNKLDHVFAGGSGVYVSKNDGDSWSNLPAGMPSDVYTNTLTISPNGYIFSGTQNGIYRSIWSTTQVSLHFSVKMLYASSFNPSTDDVLVRGNFNNWGSTGDNVYLDPVISDPDITFTGSFTTNRPDTLAGMIAGDTLRYKFVFKNTGGDNWEDDIADHIAYWDHLSDMELPAVWFNEPANDQQDYTGLTALYNSTGGSNWTNKANWLSDRPFAKWYGVAVNPTGKVRTLWLFNNNLSGSIPAQISLLQDLQELLLYRNQLTGTIPVQIGQLKNLTTLSLSDNDLTGNIPTEIGSLAKLDYLALGQNNLSGSIPDALGNLPALETLSLNSNQLSGSIPTGIWNLSNLQALILSSNQLIGTIPSNLGNLTALNMLALAENQFSGSIPSEIGNLTNLSYLDLYNNHFSGSIPITIGNLTLLEYFRLHLNQFSGQIPVEIGNLKKLREMYFSFNQLSGAVPATIGGIDSLRVLFLNANQFIDLPKLTTLTRLVQFDVQNNRLTFEDLEQNISIPNFVYSPQDSVGTAYDTTVTQYSGLSLSVSVGGNNNRYQWYLNGAVVSGATTNTYNIYSAGVTDQGTYICAITNTVATALTLYSRPITVTVPGVVSAAPILSAPIDGATDLPVNPTLIWNVTAGAESYQLQVCKNYTFTPPLTEDRSGLVTTAVQVGTLTGNTLYYWRVRASNGTGTGDWSAVWSFTTVAGTAPNPPVLSTPTNNANSVSVFPTLTWTADAGTYQVQIDDESSVNSPFIDVDTLTQPKFTVRDQGLQFNQQYYWRAAVTAGGTRSNWSETRGFTTESYPGEIQLQNTTSFPTKSKPGDFVSADYRIYGIPGNDSAPLGDPGGQAGVDWQAYWDNGQSANYLVKFDKSSTFNCITGRAFWLVSNGAVQVYMLATTATLNSDQQAEIDVHPGWNLITDPFLFPVSWDFVRQANDITVPLWSFTGNVGSLWTQVNNLQPYVGYYFDNQTNLSKLRIPYKSALGKPMAPLVKKWQLTISIESAGLKESSTQLGVAEDALAGWDQYDYRKPRAIGALPGVYFNRPEWDETYGVFATDFRPPFESMERWSLTVIATTGQAAVILVTGVEGIQTEMGVYLLDKEHLCYVDLRQQDSYSFIAARPENEFEIMVGNNAEIKQELQEIIPHEFELGKNFPNPFNPITTIPVLLPENSSINMVLYNSLGQKVKTLFEGQLSPGKHYFIWDGKDQSGKVMASGIYLYQLIITGGKKLTGKMALIK